MINTLSEEEINSKIEFMCKVEWSIISPLPIPYNFQYGFDKGYKAALESSPINEVKEDKVLIDLLRPYVLDLASYDEGVTPSHKEETKNAIKCAEIASKYFAEKVKNLPKTYGERGLGDLYQLAINDVLKLLDKS